MDDMTSDLQPKRKLKKGIVSRTFTTAKLSTRLGLGAAKKLLNVDASDPEKAVEIAAKLVNEFDGMKGLMMKFGQMASYLGTHMPQEAREILAQLQASSTAMEFALVREIIEQELEAPIEAVFDEFDENAFAAASIGQVHKAKVGNQVVAVKVQYPDIERMLSLDLNLVGKLFTVLMMGTSMPGKAMAQELRDRILEECDYELEAQNQIRIGALCNPIEGEHVPNVLSSHSGKRVLTTEFVDAQSFQAFCASASQDARNRAGLNIFNHTMNAIFRHCYFNGDPHPGNYLFHADGTVTFLDFGCVKKFEIDFISRWKAMAKTILEQRKDENLQATDALGLIGKLDKFDHDFHWEMMNHVYGPFLTDEPFTFSHAHNSRTNDYMLWENKNRFSSSMPADFLFINRLQWGLAAVMADLEAQNLYARPFKEAVYAQSIPLFS